MFNRGIRHENHIIHDRIYIKLHQSKSKHEKRANLLAIAYNICNQHLKEFRFLHPF